MRNTWLRGGEGSVSGLALAVPQKIYARREIPVLVKRRGLETKVRVEFYAEKYGYHCAHYFGILPLEGRDGIKVVSDHLGGYEGSTLEEALEKLCDALYKKHKFDVERIVVEV
jgi:hypothetical protein